MQHDSVDNILEQWQRERPDLDVQPMGVVGRVSRLAQHFDGRITRELLGFGLHSDEFDVLATLRRAGAPYQLTLTALLRSLMVSSGAMTSRLNRLEQAGWVQRHSDPHDLGSSFVQLTPAGIDLVDRSLEAHVENERRMLGALSEAEQTQLQDLLRRILTTFEAP